MAELKVKEPELYRKAITALLAKFPMAERIKEEDRLLREAVENKSEAHKQEQPARASPPAAAPSYPKPPLEPRPFHLQ